MLEMVLRVNPCQLERFKSIPSCVAMCPRAFMRFSLIFQNPDGTRVNLHGTQLWLGYASDNSLIRESDFAVNSALPPALITSVDDTRYHCSRVVTPSWRPKASTFSLSSSLFYARSFLSSLETKCKAVVLPVEIVWHKSDLVVSFF